MRRFMTRWFPAAPVFFLLAALPAAALAQGDGPTSEAGVMIGPTRYDLAGTGTGFSLHAGFTFPLSRRTVLIEPGLGILAYSDASGKRSSWMFPELTVQVQRHLGRVRPYLGAGIGTGTRGLSGVARWKFTMMGLGGARVHLAGRWGVRGEIRLRSVDPWIGHTADVSLGFTRTSF
jgi:hypothetical protein